MYCLTEREEGGRGRERRKEGMKRERLREREEKGERDGEINFDVDSIWASAVVSISVGRACHLGSLGFNLQHPINWV